MDTTADSTENPRPFGYWLTALDRLMAAEFAAVFETEGITRRDWRLLNVIDGSVPVDRRPPARKLDRLLERGWVVEIDGEWALTDEGRAAKERLGSVVDGIRAKVADAVPADDLATTIATLESLAVAFGWEEGMRLPRGRRKGGRGRHGHAQHGHAQHGGGHRTHGRHGFDHGQHDFAEHGCRGEHGHAEFADHRHVPHAESADHRHVPHDGMSHPGFPDGHARRARVARMAQGAYERGFDAGFSRGRAS